jgi:hypothetical protein
MTMLFLLFCVGVRAFHNLCTAGGFLRTYVLHEAIKKYSGCVFFCRCVDSFVADVCCVALARDFYICLQRVRFTVTNLINCNYKTG